MHDLDLYSLKFRSTRVFFGCVPAGVSSPVGSEREAARAGLISSLLGAVSGNETAPDQRVENGLSGFQVVHDGLGKPELILGGGRSLPVSFSYSGRSIWAAVNASLLSVGIDAARADEFPVGYPFARAFHEEELMHADLRIAAGVGDAAAMLWSAKEASVKAFGCGFHLLDPLEIMATNQKVHREMFECNLVVKSAKLSKQTLFCHRRVVVRSMKLGPDWVSIAVADQPRGEAEQISLFGSEFLYHTDSGAWCRRVF